MSRKKIGLFATGVLVVAAVLGGGADQDAAAVADATPSPNPTPSAAVSPAPLPSVAPAPSPSLAPTPAPLAGTVVEVVDGDTIRVELPTGVETVRIIGIDTPETVHPTEPEACFGAEASAFARQTLDGQAVTLELDPTQDERDRYDRLLAHVHVGDALYAAEAIAGGLGIHYVYEVPSIHAAELDAAETSARDGGLGLWGSCEGRVDLPLVVAPPVDEPDPEPPASADCHPSYDPCVPDVGYDLDCGDIGFPVTVIGPDEYRFDGNKDGTGCEGN